MVDGKAALGWGGRLCNLIKGGLGSGSMNLDGCRGLGWGEAVAGWWRGLLLACDRRADGHGGLWVAVGKGLRVTEGCLWAGWW